MILFSSILPLITDYLLLITYYLTCAKTLIFLETEFVSKVVQIHGLKFSYG